MEFVPFGGKDKLKLSINIVRNYLCKPTKRGHLPSDQDVMKFITLCKHRQLNPFEGDAFLLGYDGNDGPEFSLITAIQAFLKRAEVNPAYDGMESGLIVQSGTEVIDREGDFFFDGEVILGAWATVHVKGRTYPTRKRIRLQSFVKTFGVWKNNPAGMIVKCAEADALRSTFPTVLGGLYIDGEMPAEDAEIVSTSKPVPALPNGRHVVKRQAQITQESQPPAHSFEQEAEPVPVPVATNGNGKNGHHEEPASPTQDELQRDDTYNEIAMDINQAETPGDLEPIGKRLNSQRMYLGEAAHADLLAKWQAKAKTFSRK